MGRLVGDATTPANFDGGFAVLPIPEPIVGDAVVVGATIARSVAAEARVASQSDKPKDSYRVLPCLCGVRSTRFVNALSI